MNPACTLAAPAWPTALALPRNAGGFARHGLCRAGGRCAALLHGGYIRGRRRHHRGAQLIRMALSAAAQHAGMERCIFIRTVAFLHCTRLAVWEL